MAKKSQVEILVHTPFSFNNNGTVTDFVKGRHAVDKDVADHWFVAAHSDQTGKSTPGDAELQAQVDSLNTTVTELTQKLEEKEQELAALTAELETLKNGKK